ncbi:MAG TPA: cytochrome c [Thermoleophilia bacterium]|nr:cytochrome c [Thermoleophilia bacterium]
MKSRVTWGLAALICIAAVVFAIPAMGARTSSGQGSGDPGNMVDGKKVFIQFCGKCHALKAAGSKGTLGPNLDQDAVTFNRVVTAIEEGVGGIQAEYVLRNVTFNQVYDVAKYVVSVRQAGGTHGEFD